MLKTGIHSLRDLKSGKKDCTFFRKELKNASISLYEAACAEKNADSLTQRILLLFSDRRGAYKRTYSKRFNLFDKKVYEILKQKFRSMDSIKAHDVGVSDGRTSVDFFTKVYVLFPKIQFTASDYNPTIKILKTKRLKVALTESNQLLEITYSPFVFNAVKRDSYRHYPLNHVIRKIIELFLVAPLLRSYQKGIVKAKSVFLFAPSAINLQKKNQHFNLSQHDVLNPFKETYTFIRAMNVLNPSYFSNDDFQKIVQHMYDGLENNGLLITGSNQEANSTVDGAVYKKNKNGFGLVWTSGKGSQIHDHLIEFTP